MPTYCRTNWAICILPYLEAQNLYESYDNNLPNGDLANKLVLQTTLPVMSCPSDPLAGQLAATSYMLSIEDAARGSYKGVAGVNNVPGFLLLWDFHDQNHNPSQQANPQARGPLHVTGNDPNLFRPVQVSEIRDGLSNTLLVGEYHSTTGDSWHMPFWASTTAYHNLSLAWAESYARGLPDLDDCVNISGGDWLRCQRAFASLHSGNMLNFVTCGGSVIRISPNMDGALYEAAGTIAGGEILLLE